MVGAVEDGGGAAPEQLAGLQMMRRLDIFVIEIDKKSHDGGGDCVIRRCLLSVLKRERRRGKEDKKDKVGRWYQSLDRSTALGESEDKMEPLGG